MKKVLLVSAVLLVTGLIYSFSRPIAVIQQQQGSAVTEVSKQSGETTNAATPNAPQANNISVANASTPTSMPRLAPEQSNVLTTVDSNQISSANRDALKVTPAPLPTVIPTKKVDRSSICVPDQAFYDSVRDNPLYQDDIEDFEERTPGRDLTAYRAVEYTRARHLALLVTDEFFRRFSSPALYDMDIVKEVIAHGTVDTSSLQTDVKIQNLTDERNPFIDYLCGKDHCLIAWREEFKQYLDPAEEMCAYINSEYGSDCQPARLNDRLITPLEFAKASTICSARFLDDIDLAKSSTVCFQVVLSPTNAVLFRHNFSSTPVPQAFANQFIDALYQADVNEIIENDYEEGESDYMIELTDGYNDYEDLRCQGNHCFVTLPNYAVGFQPFDYAQLTRKLSAAAIKEHHEPWYSEPVFIEESSELEPARVTGKYKTYLQNNCPGGIFCDDDFENYTWGWHFQEIWNWMNGLPASEGPSQI
ncbi:RodZ family helix-turn-helix domain-containing protein [Salinibius halmophilus]|uniref:hypothetical protein n=1 Tax=Salinibius halmophilus TaxID=1853216 RepID=UPI000E662B17|nr:hypothetical protein [Salinibius halmophilus]